MPRETIGLDAGRGRGPGGSGRLFPDATLPTRDGERLSLERYRSRNPLVVLMLGAGDIPERGAALLATLAAARDEIAAEGGEVLAVIPGEPERTEREWRWPFPLLIDREGALHRRLGAIDEAGQSVMALFVTDRFREIYADLRPDEPGWPASARDVLEWLTFVEIQCPECNPPEG